MLPAFASGALLGLLNLGHCAGMCGPLAAAGCGRSGRTAPFRYQLGRVLAYGFAGAMCGHIGSGLQLYAPARWTSWVFAALTAAACLFTARQLTRGQAEPRLIPLRTGGAPARRWLSNLLALLPRDPLPLGLLSVLLPCGLLATALLAAVATGSAETGSLFMTGFAATSGTAILAAGWLVQRLPRFSLPVRRGLAVLLIAGAVATVARPLTALGPAAPRPAASAPACH